MNIVLDLYRLAERDKLITAFQAVTVHAKLILDSTGYTGIKPFEGGSARIQAPITKRQGKCVAPYYGYDNEEYSLGIVLDEERSQLRFDAYWDQTESFVQASGDSEALQAVQAARTRSERDWLSSARKVVSKLLKEASSKSKNKTPHIMLALYVGESLLVNRPLIRGYFDQKLKEEMEEEGPDTCLITGKKCKAVITHNRIQGVPGTGGGFPLIGFNQMTSTQGRLKQGRNFPVSPRVMNGYTSAGNYVVENNRFNLSASVCGVLWGPSQASQIAKVIGGSQKNQEELLEAWTQVESLQDSEEPLHTLYLKGSKGRIAPLSYDILSTGMACRSLIRFRDHFRMFRFRDNQQMIEMPSVASKLKEVSEVRSKSKDSHQILDGLTKVRIIESLLNDDGDPEETRDPIPENAMQRITLNIYPVNLTDQSKEKKPSTYYATLCQLDWFAFIASRKGYFQPPRKDESMVVLEEPQLEDYVITPKRNEPLEHYHMGRLIAVEEAIRDQAYSRKMSTSSLSMIAVNPSLWLTEHDRRMQIYEDKLLSQGIRGTYYTKMAEGLIVKIRDIDLVNSTEPLSVKEMASLGLGYRHQRAYIHARSRWSFQQRTAKKKAA